MRVSATPSPSASRSSVMRLALGTAGAGALHDLLHDQALDALAGSGRFGGALVSATSTSPLGSTRARGWARPAANALTATSRRRGAPSGQPLAGAMLTVGIGVVGSGGGSVGLGPIAAFSAIGSCRRSRQHQRQG